MGALPHPQDFLINAPSPPLKNVKNYWKKGVNGRKGRKFETYLFWASLTPSGGGGPMSMSPPPPPPMQMIYNDFNCTEIWKSFIFVSYVKVANLFT